MKKIYAILLGLHLFVGIGALFGGGAAVINPKEPLGAPVDMLKNSPFSDFLIPGMILLLVLGFGNIISAIMFRFKLRVQGYISSVFSWALVIWIVIQCIMIRAIAPPHILFFTIGVFQAGLSMTLLFEKQLFPANLIANYYKGVTKKL